MASFLLPTAAPVAAAPAPFMSQSAGSALARLLAGLGAAATSYGAGSPQWGISGAQAISQADQQQDQQRRQALQDQITQEQLQRQRDADARDQAQRDAAQKAFGSLMIGQAPPAGLYDGQGRAGASVAGPSPLDGLSPVEAAAIKAKGGYDPAGAVDDYWSLATAKPAAPVVNDGLQYDAKTGTWTPIPGYLEQKKAIAEAGRAPVQPPQMPAELQEYQMDQAALKAAGKPRQTFGEWKRGLNSGPSVTYGDPITGDAAAAIGFDPKGSYQKGSDGKWYVAQAPEKPTVTYQTLTGADLAKVNPNLDPAKTWKVGSDGTATVVDKPDKVGGPIITGDDASSLKLDPTGSYQQRPDGTYAVLVKPRAEGTFGGNALDAQDSNIILKGQSDEAYRQTPEYAMAWSRQYEQPKPQYVTDPTDSTKQIVQFTKVAPPTNFKGPGGTATTVPAPGADGTTQSGGLIVGSVPGSQSGKTAPPGYKYTADSQLTYIPGGPADPNTATPEQRNKVNDKLTGLDNLQSALDNYKALISGKDAAGNPVLDANGNPVKPVTPGIGGSIIGLPTSDASQLGSAYTALAIQAKNLFELGALSGPDYGLIQQTLQDPNTTRGYFQEPDARVKQIEEVQKILTNSRNSLMKNYGPAMRDGNSSIDALKKKFNITPVNP